MCNIVEKCNIVENAPFITDSNGNKIITNVGFCITSQYLNILELCTRNFNRDIVIPYTVNHHTFVLSCKYINEKRVNIIITNSHLLPFWESSLHDLKHITTYHNLKCFVVSNVQKFESNQITADDTCIILTFEMFKKLWSKYPFFREIKYDRMILHNLENNNVLQKFNVMYGFKWIVTTHLSLLENVMKSDHLSMLDNIVVQNTDLPTDSACTPKEEIIYSKRPIASITLEGLVEKTIIDGLESYDIKRVIKHLSSPLIKTEADVLKHVVKRFTDNLRVVEENEICIERMEYANVEDKQARLDNISKLKKTLIEKKDALIKRITKNNLCFICYDEINVKCVIKCCANVVCFHCINKWLQMSDSCPLCKFDKFKYLIIEENETVNANKDVTLCDSISKNNYIFQNFHILIQQRLACSETFKILVVGKDDTMLNRFKTLLDKNKIQFLDFKGNSYMLKKKIRMFTRKDVHIMFLNNTVISCGIPLLCVTDIILLSPDTNCRGIINECTNTKNVWKFMYSSV